MRSPYTLSTAVYVLCLVTSCGVAQPPVQERDKKLILGDQQLDILIPKLKDKRVALIVNNTSLIGTTHIADSLKKLSVNVTKIFAPEHGFRGTAAAGEHVQYKLVLGQQRCDSGRARACELGAEPELCGATTSK